MKVAAKFSDVLDISMHTILEMMEGKGNSKVKAATDDVLKGNQGIEKETELRTFLAFAEMASVCGAGDDSVSDEEYFARVKQYQETHLIG